MRRLREVRARLPPDLVGHRVALVCRVGDVRGEGRQFVCDPRRPGGLISTELFSILVITAIVTTAMAMAMPVYRASMPDWLEEAERESGRMLAVRAAAGAPVAAHNRVHAAQANTSAMGQ